MNPDLWVASPALKLHDCRAPACIVAINIYTTYGRPICIYELYNVVLRVQIECIFVWNASIWTCRTGAREAMLYTILSPACMLSETFKNSRPQSRERQSQWNVALVQYYLTRYQKLAEFAEMNRPSAAEDFSVSPKPQALFIFAALWNRLRWPHIFWGTPTRIRQSWAVQKALSKLDSAERKAS